MAKGRLNSGMLDRQLTIRTVTYANDAAGQPVETWADGDTVWAQRDDKDGREASGSGERAAEVDAVFIIRYRDDVTPVNRVSIDGREYDVVSVLEIGRREGLEISARARAE